MNLQDIEAFVAVAETGSVSRAALRLNLTQPATTRRIQNFEAAMGDAAVFNRAVKPAALTAVGSHVLEYSRRVLSAIAELEACSTNAAAPAGDLKAGIAHGLGEIVLTAPLDALRRSFPQIRLQISSSWTADLVEHVRSGALDCAIGLLTDGHTIPAGLIRIPLGAERIVIVAAGKAATREDGKPWRLRDLAREGWFLNPPGCGCRAALLRSFDRLQLPIRIEAEVFGEDLQLSLLVRSGGLGLVPLRQLEQSPHRHELQVLEMADFTLPTSVALIRGAAPGRFDRAIAAMAGDLKARLEKHPSSA